ncbi:MAG: hypothetical protein NTW78_04025 [Campylobacterales bacterium]|nr:hypothetical protein [Campylobacterales bacterium]
MKAFEKVLEQIKNAPLNGHALGNVQNRESLAKAKIEIKKMLGVGK